MESDEEENTSRAKGGRSKKVKYADLDSEEGEENPEDQLEPEDRDSVEDTQSQSQGDGRVLLNALS